MKIAIVGGGLSGLSLAYYLAQSESLKKHNETDLKVTIFEKDKWGGLIQTIPYKNEKVVELAANGFLGHPEFFKICNSLELQPLPAAPNLGRFIFRNKITKWPLKSFENLSLIKLAFKLLFFRKSLKPLSKESIRDWGYRTLGEVITDYLLEPILRGIYSGDYKKLSATLFFERFNSKEKTKGLYSFRDGMGEFILRLKNKLQLYPNIIFKSEEIKNLEYLINDFDQVVIATAPTDAGNLLSKINLNISQQLLSVEMRSIASVTLFLDKDKPISGYGCLFPENQKMNSLGVLWSRDIFKSHGSRPVERWMILDRTSNISPQIKSNGHSNHQISTDQELINKIKEDRLRLYNQELPFPQDYHIQRWPQGLPHMTTNIEEYIKTWNEPLAYLNKQIFLHGNYLGKMGTTDLILRSKNLAQTLLMSKQPMNFGNAHQPDIAPKLERVNKEDIQDRLVTTKTSDRIDVKQ